MTENKRFVKKYIDEFNPEIDMVETDVLTIVDEVTSKRYYMDFLDDDEKQRTIDDIINNWNELNDENQAIQRKVFKLMDWLETEKGISKEEVKRWWND